MSVFSKLDVQQHPTEADVLLGSSKPATRVTRLGFLFNARVTSVQLPNRGRASALRFIFVDGAGETFSSTVPFRPYFYLKIRRDFDGLRLPSDVYKDVLLQLAGAIPSRATRVCRHPVTCEYVERVDLEEPGHITRDSKAPYRTRAMLKVSVSTTDDLRMLVNNLSKHLETHAGTLELIRSQARETNRQVVSMASAFQRHESKVAIDSALADPTLLAEGLCEHQVNYLPRALIDLGLRCGKWYKVTWKPRGVPMCDVYPKTVILSDAPEEVSTLAPPLRYLSWDIEVTKSPLKFPNPQKDVIMCISAMVADQGFLLVNNSVVREEIPSFEYTPKPEFPGRMLFT